MPPDRLQAIRRAEQLLRLAIDPGTSREEARTAAMQLARVIHAHRMLQRHLEPEEARDRLEQFCDVLQALNIRQ